MAFFNVDDQMHSHPKHVAAGIAATGLWTRAGSFCRNYKQDGQVPSWFVAGVTGGKRAAAQLVAHGLWHASGHDCAGCPQPDDRSGWVFHDWLDINSSAEEVERQREAARKRQAKRRARLHELQEKGVADV